MNAYLPHDLVVVVLAHAVLAATLVLGFAVTRIRRPAVARSCAWALVVAATATVERLCAGEPPGLRMLVIIAATLYAMKAVVSVESIADGRPALPAWRWLAFAALWPGMRPAVFAGVGDRRLRGAGELISAGAMRLFAGVILIAGARLVWVHAPPALSDSQARLIATALLLPGLSLVLHFGIFNLLAGAWRLAGADCRPLFRAPLASRSLTEFWGRRWNLAFSEMTAIGIYRPLSHAAGKSAATVAAFLCSGVLHELAISLPVRRGYGLPMLYFALQAGLVLIERALDRAGRPIDRVPWLGRAWTVFWLVLPMPILFHPWFLDGIVWPLVGMGRTGR